MTKNKREIYAAEKPLIRELESGASRLIEGYAIVFGRESELLADWCEMYREVIKPGAITQEQLDNSDIKMTLWHNNEKLLARANKGEGTLHLSVDKKGVKYSFEAPNTPDGQTAVELVRRGDIAGASFIGYMGESDFTYSERPDGAIIRSVDRIPKIEEMTLTSDPAYTQTSAEMPKAVRDLLHKAEKPEEPQYVSGPLIAKARQKNRY